MSEEQTISLIIPAFNEEKYIGSCLDFITNNSAGRFLEIIVVNNTGNDQTEAIASKCPNVRVITGPQIGPNDARQHGALEAKGDILAFVDADTRMPIGWPQRVAREFSRHPRLALLSGPYFYYDLPFWQKRVADFYQVVTWFMAFVVGYAAIGGNFAIRRSVWEQMGGIDASIKFYGDDTDIARRAHKFGKVKFSLKFYIYTSGRRFAGQGLIKTGLLYAANFLSEVIFRRPITKGYGEPFR